MYYARSVIRTLDLVRFLGVVGGLTIYLWGLAFWFPALTTVKAQTSAPPCGDQTKVFSSKAFFVPYFDCLLNNSGIQAGLLSDDDIVNNDATIAFNTTHLLHSYLDMYELTRDPKYLDLFTQITDKYLNLRDDKRGLTIFGKSTPLPVWSVNSFLTLAYPKTLLDDTGNPSLEVLPEHWAHNQTFVINVTDGTNPGTFKLSITNRHRNAEIYGEVHVFDNLTMNSFNTTYTEISTIKGLTGLKFKKVGPNRPKNFIITSFQTKRIVNLHKNGGATSPLARFSLMANQYDWPAIYETKAPAYKQTAIETVSAIDSLGEWVDMGSYGYYQWKSTDGGGFYLNNVPYPFNYSSAIGKTYIYLYRGSTGEEKERYRTRLTKMANGFMYCGAGWKRSETDATKCVTPVIDSINGNRYNWPYQQFGNYVEHTVHAHDDLDFINLLLEDGFLTQDVGIRFANSAYFIVKNTDQNPPKIEKDVIGIKPDIDMSDSLKNFIFTFQRSSVVYSRYRRDLFDKSRNLFSLFPLDQYYSSVAKFGNYYNSLTRTALIADRNNWWSQPGLPTNTPAPTLPPIPTATITPTMPAGPTSTPTVAPSRTPTPTLSPPTATPTTQPVTLTPTPTAQPTSTPTPLPTATLAPDAPTPTITPTHTPSPSPVATSTPNPDNCNKSSDLNNDGVTDLSDASIMIAKMGQSGDNLPEDLNCDGLIDLSDWSILISQLDG